MILNSNSRAVHEIGGECGLSLKNFLQPQLNASLNLPFKKHSLFLDTGRSAIYIALLSIIEHSGKREAWLPLYCCDSVLMPFKELKFKVNFYSMGGDLQTPSCLPTRFDGETFLFIHYFGKTNQPILDYLQQIKKKHYFFVIEDCVQALLNPQIGTHDYAVYSFRKFLPQPDGAVLASDHLLHDFKLAPASETFISSKLIAKLIQHSSDDEDFLQLLAQAEKIIDASVYPRQMSFLSHYLLPRTNTAQIAQTRRNNFFYLQELLIQLDNYHEHIHPLFHSLEDTEIPLGLPVVINPVYRNKLRDFLKNNYIYCPVHWPLQTVDNISWKTELNLSESILTLPIDQRLNPADLTFLAEKIIQFFKSG